MKKKKITNQYLISFLPLEMPNWASVSSIRLDEILNFLKWIKEQKEEDIIIDRYVPGGYVGPMHVDRYLDKTWFAKKIMKSIRVAKDVRDAYRFAAANLNEIHNYETPYLFNEDRYEEALQFYQDPDKALEDVKEFIDKGALYTRYVLVYMFRSMFIKWCASRGLEVVVSGGWVLNDKKREKKIGIIDGKGRLIDVVSK